MNALDRIAIRAATNRSKHVSYSLACAIASRESNCRNIVGDGGHGRGMFQLDDRYQQQFLRTHRGCRSDTSVPIYSNALAKGRVPTVFAGAKQMCEMIDSNIARAAADNVPFGHRTRLAVSAYNAGYASALAGFHVGDADLKTTGGNYARDVMKRMLSF